MKPDPIGDTLLWATVLLVIATAVYAAEAMTGVISRLFGRKA